MLTTAAPAAVRRWVAMLHAWSVTSEDAKCERSRISKIRARLGMRNNESYCFYLLLFNFLCNLNRAPFKWSLDFHPTSPARKGGAEPLLALFPQAKPRAERAVTFPLQLAFLLSKKRETGRPPRRGDEGRGRSAGA